MDFAAETDWRKGRRINFIQTNTGTGDGLAGKDTSHADLKTGVRFTEIG